MSKLKTTDKNFFGGEWSLKKLHCVSRYLESYLAVFKNKKWADLWYIDAFCGSGYQGIKNDVGLFDDEEAASIELIEGSAIRAVKVAADRDLRGEKSFDHFVFIEFDKAKIKELKSYIARDYPKQYAKCIFINDDVNRALPQWLFKIDWKRARGVTFIDPCSLQLQWKTMECFKGTCVDVWLLFPLEAIIRMLPNDHRPSKAWENRLNVVLGGDDWKGIYHQPRINQIDIFGNMDESYEREHGIDEVLEFAKKKYQTIFPKVMSPAILRGRKHNPLFALFPLFANESKSAQRIAAKISKHLVDSINES